MIIQLLQNLATQLNKRNLSTADVRKVIPVSNVKVYFGSLGNALEAAGLERTDSAEHFKGRGNILSEDDLFQSLYEVENELGHEPKSLEYSAQRKYSIRPFKKRFGKWEAVLKQYRKWKAEKSSLQVQEGSESNEISQKGVIGHGSAMQPNILPTIDGKPPQLYGEPIEFRGLRHAPVNEQGVVYLFGMVSRELGFYIEAVQQGFPDCEGKYLYDAKKNLWAKARIEFEYEASSFQKHGHDSNQCDFIVCWINDWKGCPIKVIELRTEILKLPSKK